jgi:hypothetical protein
MHRLLAEIELPEQRLAEFFEQLIHREALPGVGVLVQERRDLPQGLEIAQHLLAQTRALHFEHDLAPVAQHRTVDLRHRGRRQRRGINEPERRRRRDAKLLGQDPFDVRKRQRVAVVLQARQGLGVGGRHDVRPRGEQLAELDEGWPEPLYVGGELPRRRGRLAIVLRLLRQQLGEPCALHEVAPAILEQEQREVLVVLEMFGL